jgi:CheY-like chemotaxis protein
VREAMRTLLEGWQCRPVICSGSEEALRELRRLGLQPEAVLADYRLAGAENGLEAIARLCERYGEIPAAIVTGEINAAEIEIPESMPAIVMQKPLRAADLRDWLLLWRSGD